MTMDIGLWAGLGFLLSAYAVVGNDALQTLGTFINSNRRFPWWALFIYAAIIMAAAFLWGWYNGDVSYGRLARYPEVEIEWYHALPPLALLILTRTGIPVSTTFMVLTIFAVASANLTGMLEKSLVGYGLAFLVGGVVYLVLAPTLERFFFATEHQQHHPVWTVLQWASTGFLWWQWLSQDFANIYVFLPRQLELSEAVFSLAIIICLLGITFANSGGPVQRILLNKRHVTDIRSATIIDFLFAWLLFYFKELNNIPMSTTWVFLGLIGGREFVMRHIDLDAGKGIFSILGDFFDALTGFLVTFIRYLLIGVEPGKTARNEQLIEVSASGRVWRQVVRFFPLATVIAFLFLFLEETLAYALIGGLILLSFLANRFLLNSRFWSAFRLEEEDVIEAADNVHSDAVKAMIGLIISVVLAVGLPRLAVASTDIFASLVTATAALLQL